jgi:hypothetical protein
VNISRVTAVATFVAFLDLLPSMDIRCHKEQCFRGSSSVNDLASAIRQDACKDLRRGANISCNGKKNTSKPGKSLKERPERNTLSKIYASVILHPNSSYAPKLSLN